MESNRISCSVHGTRKTVVVVVVVVVGVDDPPQKEVFKIIPSNRSM